MTTADGQPGQRCCCWGTSHKNWYKAPPREKMCLMPSPVTALPHPDRTKVGSLCTGPHTTLSLRRNLSVFLVIKGKCWCWIKQHLPPNCSSAAPDGFSILCSFQLSLLPRSHPANHSSISILGKPRKGALLSRLLEKIKRFLTPQTRGKLTPGKGADNNHKERSQGSLQQLVKAEVLLNTSHN